MSALSFSPGIRPFKAVPIFWKRTESPPERKGFFPSSKVKPLVFPLKFPIPELLEDRISGSVSTSVVWENRKPPPLIADRIGSRSRTLIRVPCILTRSGFGITGWNSDSCCSPLKRFKRKVLVSRLRGF